MKRKSSKRERPHDFVPDYSLYPLTYHAADWEIHALSRTRRNNIEALLTQIEEFEALFQDFDINNDEPQLFFNGYMSIMQAFHKLLPKALPVLTLNELSVSCFAGARLEGAVTPAAMMFSTVCLELMTVALRKVLYLAKPKIPLS